MNVDSFEHLSRYVVDEIKFVNDVLAVTGLFYLSKLSIKVTLALADFVKVHIIPKLCGKCSLAELYGGNWAVVTGSSEGIGFAYANELAKRGLNIVLISNDTTKLQNSAIEINEKFGVQIDFISLHFDGDPVKYERIKETLKDKRIGILVNNVGVMYDYPQMFLEVSQEMTHMILPQMVERRKGAIVNISAGASSKPTPHLAVYTATKGYIDLFSKALEYEYKGLGITVQCLTPFYVATRMQRYMASLSRPSTIIPTAQEYAKHAVETLGYSNRTSGYWPHTVQGWLADFIPDRLWMWGANRFSNALKRQALERVMIPRSNQDFGAQQ